MAAAKAMLAEIHSPLSQPSTDPNAYILGGIHGHHIVVACLPSGVYGITSAAMVVSHLVSTFPRIQFGLMVGIGGGVTSNDLDIRLGDIVVSKPTGSYGGVVQYDYGKTMTGGQLHKTGMMNQPPAVLLTSVARLQADHIIGTQQSISKILSNTLEQDQVQRSVFTRPECDYLFHSKYTHVESESTCEKCDMQQLVHREPRAARDPQIHYGLIASGNQVMRDAQTRDRLAQESAILCFEMEAAGMMNQLPCLVIRGICDYADSHKNKEWQGYAALAAAAYTKLLLSVVPVTQYKTEPDHRSEFTAEEKACLRSLFITDPIEDKNVLKRRKGDRAPGTCEWIMDTQELQTWLALPSTETHSNILWLYGNPGTGKSTMAITLAEELPNQSLFTNGDNILIYFFCDSSSQERCTATAILRGLLYQLVKQRPQLVKHLLHKFEERKEKLFDSFDGLWTIFIDIARESAKCQFYCIIDALDECDQESQKILLTQIRQSFRNCKNHMSLSIHFLITSRPYPEIGEYLYRFKSKDLSSYQKVQDDLQVLIEQKVSELSQTKRYSEKVTRAVSSILQEKAEGTFLWVGIACDELAGVRSRDAVKTLQSLPQGLDSLYAKLLETALEKTGKEDYNTILQMLGTVTISRRPLSVAELSIACGLYEDEDEEDRLAYAQEDIEMCRLMIVVQDGIVRLLHKSVKDFLLRVRGGSLVNELRTNGTLANRCVDFLLSNTQLLDGPRNKEQKSGFLQYAVLYWPEHASAAQSEFIVLPRHRCFFQLRSEGREKWLQAYRDKVQFYVPQRFSIWHVAARWGLVSLVHFALVDKKQSIIAEKIENGAKETEFNDTEYTTENGSTPMEEAARRGRPSVLALFLERGDTRVEIGTRVLVAAAQNEESGKEIMTLLLDRRGDQIKITEKVVTAAARNQFYRKEIMALLLD